MGRKGGVAFRPYRAGEDCLGDRILYTITPYGAGVSPGMRRIPNKAIGVAAALTWLCAPMLARRKPGAWRTLAPGGWLSPSAMAAVTKDGGRCFIACATANQVLRWDTAGRKVADRAQRAGAAVGVGALSRRGSVFVTCSGPVSTVCVVGVGQVSPSRAGRAPDSNSGHSGRRRRRRPFSRAQSRKLVDTGS